MYNPFPLLNLKLLSDKIGEGKRYFVRQTFPRGKSGRVRAAFLIRAYDNFENVLADQHLQSLVSDSNACLYDATVPEQLEKLKIAAQQPHGYKIFYSGTTTHEWKPPKQYVENITAYIRNHHPGWRTKKGGDKIDATLYEEFGKLFIKLSFDKEEEKIPIEVIE